MDGTAAKFRHIQQTEMGSIKIEINGSPSGG
jgi:hypothetical protein